MIGPLHFRRRTTRDAVVAFACGGFVAVMVGVSFAAVPLYSWFCRVTGFAGTTQVAKTAPEQTSSRVITVRFDSNVAPGLPWSFQPERRTVDVRLGEVVTVYYAVRNETARVTTGQAGYNVTPPTVGAYFEKINCFCFTQQTLQPGEKRDIAAPTRRWRRAPILINPGTSRARTSTATRTARKRSV